MIRFLHTFEPSSILFNIGPITIHWYGFLYVVAFIVGIFLAWRLARSRRVGVTLGDFIDLSTILLAAGIVGARLWYVVLIEPLYFFSHPLAAFAVWQGGLAFHGGLVGALIALIVWAQRRHIAVITVTDVLAPSLALGQAIGRWGNYFNQELYGRVTDLPWGIPIGGSYHHPTFLYESLGLLALALVLAVFSRCPSFRAGLVTGVYMIAAGTLRFVMELFRIDATPTFLLRLPQWAALVMVVVGIVLIYSSRWGARRSVSGRY